MLIYAAILNSLVLTDIINEKVCLLAYYPFWSTRKKGLLNSVKCYLPTFLPIGANFGFTTQINIFYFFNPLLKWLPI